MKQFKHLFTTLSITALTLITSCTSKDDNPDYFAGIPAPTSAEFDAIRQSAMEDNTQHFQFDASDGFVTLTSSNGVEISLNTSCLSQNGNPVTGPIDLEYVEIFEKANMLVTNKPTMGRLPNGDKTLIITGGEFFLEATNNGLPLDANCGLSLLVPSALTGGFDPAMTLWNGEIDTDGNLTWDQIEPGTNDGVFDEMGEYYAVLQGFGWSNIDRFYSDPRPKTQILVKAPQGFNFGNSAVYLSYDGEDSGLASLDTYDNTFQAFSEHYGQIPIGLECHIIFITTEDGLWKYAIKPVTIANDDIITFTLDDLVIGDDNALQGDINVLP
ncbi:hypothetical protein ES677_10010 [Bizionia gelidisalsuginis]|uniref:Lipoprotein n=1 Tax=Bizionia gelidisalsuginis TaxID=291188 RepID=A0ABY3M9H0_9FLAO|nr:hypothetical protein [Bizionia gelidisalsuginis]TYC11397.1 hypothetical protein ES677_10010 [Bizionia gelidisalsuginis]